jgi:hypothetical protein
MGQGLSFIPRMVVHKAEIERIYFPDAQFMPAPSSRGRDPALMIPEDDQPDTEDQSSTSTTSTTSTSSTTTTTTNSSTAKTKRLAQNVLKQLKEEFPGAFLQAASELPSTLAQMAVTAPVAIVRISSDVAGEVLSFSNRVQDLPEHVLRLSQQLPVRAIQLTVDMGDRVVQVSSDVAHGFVELPHKVSHSWGELVWVLLLLVGLTLLVSGVVYFIPLANVNDGLAKNRAFHYGVLTYYEILTLAPIIETCNFAMPQAKIPIRARLLTLIVGITAQKAFDAILGEAVWWPNRHIFPIPFSLILSGVASFFLIIPILRRTTKNSSDFPFDKTFKLLCIYATSLMVVGFWAIGVRALQGRMFLQSVVGCMYGPLRFICKILMGAPLTTKLNPRRWIILNLVEDILFTRVQVSTFPFIDSFLPFLLLFSTEVITLFWRYYGGVDRLALWWNGFVAKFTKRDQEICKVHQEFGTSMRAFTTGCIVAPIPHIAQIHLDMRTVSTNSSRSMAESLSSASDSDGEDAEEQCPVETKPKDSQLAEEHWVQRPLYHIIDAVGSTVISIIVRVNQQLSMFMARNMSISRHLNKDFEADADRWRVSQIYGWVFIILMMGILASLGGIFFARLEERSNAHRRLTMSRVVSYICRDHFWFLFLWLSSTGGYVAATMIQHFGADFTLHFDWLGCPENEIMWPSCAVEPDWTLASIFSGKA